MATRKKAQNKLAQRYNLLMRAHRLADSKPVRASDYFHWFKAYRRKHPDVEVILYNRESTVQQDHQKHEEVLRRVCRKQGVPVVGEFYQENCSGKLRNFDREALIQAIRMARSLNRKGRHVAILATSTDRYLRHIAFNPKKNPDALPTVGDFGKFNIRWSHDVVFLTLLHPNMPWERVRGFQSKWGQRTTGNTGGRPRKSKLGYMKQRRHDKLDRVLRLRRKGMSFRKIKKLTGVPKTTAWEWVRKYL